MNMDRRQETRVPLQLPVQCSGFDDETYLSFSHDMSPNGMSLGTNGSFPVGSPCRLRFTLPNHQKEREITGHVCWHTGQGAAGRVGIQFSEPIDFSVPFRAADQAVRGLQAHMNSYLGSLHRTLGDASAWVDSEGKIVQCDERFVKLLGYSKEDVQGYPLTEFVHVDDRHRLSNLLMEAQESGLSSSEPGLFCMQPKDGHPVFWRIRAAAKPPWSTSGEIYIEDMTDSCALEGKKHELEQIVSTLRRAVPGRAIRLNTDLRIADIYDDETAGTAHKQTAFFNGTDLRKATGLVETRINGRKLWEELQTCVTTGQEFESDDYYYEGRPGKQPDLFPPGAFRTIIKPITDLDDRVTSLLMVVGPAKFVSIYPEKKKENLFHLEHILRAAARGFLLKDVVKETCDPLTCLLARLDLLRHKVTMEREKSEAPKARETAYYLGEIQEVEKLVENLSEHFRGVLQNTCYLQPLEIAFFDISQSIARAIGILEMCGGLNGYSIRFESPSAPPMMEACEQEFVMIFLIFLLLSRTCLKNVCDRTITCETVTNKKHVIAKISHNGFVHRRKYLDIIFHSDPLETYFFKSDSVCCMDTLLYYGNLLLKKNKIRTKITNIPGQFSLSLVMPFRAR